jgi:RNA polymerase sigma-70 factor (ECF subfamily)
VAAIRVTETERIREETAAVYRAESRRVFATLVRLLGDFDLAEEALHDAFRAALEQWPRDGVPANPRAWLVSAGRFKAIDGIRRLSRFDAIDDVADEVEAIADDAPAPWEAEVIEDDRLRLIFTCCHPALSPEAQIALTLREVCGLATEEIAQAFLLPAPTLAQRIVRAKAKIKDARIPYQVPGPDELPERLASALRVIYLVFNEGYSPSSGQSLTRVDLSVEAIRLGRLLADLLPEAEAQGLLGLMLLQESRRVARASPTGEIILLPDQDRSLWNRDQIAEGVSLVERALASRRFGPYALQAAIAAVHAEAPSADATDWNEIVGLYDVLLRAEPSPVIELNRAVAGGHARWTRTGSRVGRRHPCARRARRLPPRPRHAGRPLPPAGSKRRSADRLRAGDVARPSGARAALSGTPPRGIDRLTGGRSRPEEICRPACRFGVLRFD